MKIYILDNYDSFTFNLQHYFEALNCEVIVQRNDEVDHNLIIASDAIVLSPGPGLPINAGSMMDIIKNYHLSKPILGVCLGHQALAEFFGGSLFNMDRVMHGKEVSMIHESSSLFIDIDSPLKIGLYHSWAVDLSSSSLISTGAWKDVNMAFEHPKLPIFGVQFHPESILTQSGKEILKNFLSKID